MDVSWAKREFGKDLTFWGGISTQRLLPFKSPAEVRATIQSLLRIIGESGGYIAAPTHDVPRDVPIESRVATIETLRGQTPSDAALATSAAGG